MRIWIIADYPGYWFLHCHIESHQMEGMSVIINELPSKQNCPPAVLQTLICGNFNWNVESFDVAVQFPQLCSTSGCNTTTKAGGMLDDVIFSIHHSSVCLDWVLL